MQCLSFQCSYMAIAPMVLCHKQSAARGLYGHGQELCDNGKAARSCCPTDHLQAVQQGLFAHQPRTLSRSMRSCPARRALALLRLESAARIPWHPLRRSGIERNLSSETAVNRTDRCGQAPRPTERCCPLIVRAIPVRTGTLPGMLRHV